MKIQNNFDFQQNFRLPRFQQGLTPHNLGEGLIQQDERSAQEGVLGQKIPALSTQDKVNMMVSKQMMS